MFFIVFEGLSFGEKIKNSGHELVLKKVGFTPCKAERPLQGMELQEKQAQKD